MITGRLVCKFYTNIGRYHDPKVLPGLSIVCCYEDWACDLHISMEGEGGGGVLQRHWPLTHSLNTKSPIGRQSRTIAMQLYSVTRRYSKVALYMKGFLTKHSMETHLPLCCLRPTLPRYHQPVGCVPHTEVFIESGLLSE